MPERWITHARDLLDGWFLALLVAWAGRLAWHAAETQRGNRAFFSRDLLLEQPAVLVGFAGAMGLAEWLQLGEWARLGLAAWGGYLGPRGLAALVRRYVAHRFPVSPTAAPAEPGGSDTKGPTA